VAQSGPRRRLHRCSPEEGGLIATVHGFQQGLVQNEEGDMGILTNVLSGLGRQRARLAVTDSFLQSWATTWVPSDQAPAPLMAP
jgi:hypothetical protein